MHASPKLHVERMEDRLTPAMFGLPWLDPDVTVSFAPDGTRTEGVKSSLFAKLAADGMTAPQWQGEIKRAFQSWATAGHLNFGLVADGGDDFGTAGRVQGDTRFGDIRVTARPLGVGVLAITTPPGYTSETLAGDIVLNADYRFAVNPAEGSGRYDLYTVMLQEIGHAIGVGNSGDPNSVMYEQYKGTRGGLTAGDVTAAQRLYGTRRADGYEGESGNGSRGTAAELPVAPGTSTRHLRGDFTTFNDTDFYTFVTPAQMPNGVTVRLSTAGLSLASVRAQIQDAAGNVVAATPINAAPGADQEVTTALAPNTRYYLRVNAPTAATYRVGSYDLRVVFDPTAPDPAAKPLPTMATDGGTNNTVATATVLSPQAGTTAQRYYDTFAKLESTSDVDVYKITAPPVPAGTTTLHVHLASFPAGKNFGDYAPKVTVHDRNGGVLAVEDLTYYSYRRAYQLQNVPGGETYYLAVSRSSWVSDTEYKLTAYFQPAAVNYDVRETLTFGPTKTSAYRTLTVNDPQVFTFGASAETANLALVTVDVYDANRTLVKSWTDYTFTTNGASLLLMPGEYTIRVRVTFSWFGDARLTLRLGTLTDPIGLAPPADPTTTPTAGVAPPPPAEPTFGWHNYDPSYYAWLM